MTAPTVHPADAPTDRPERTTTRRPAPGPATDDHRWRLRRIAMCVVFAALCLNSRAGTLTPDTKTDLVVSPGRFLARALQLWDPQGFAGQVQNQAYGYLFPMGPFFWVQHAMGVPGWVVQRLWWTLLLSVAFLGVDALARALRIGTPLSRFVAAAAYATTPHVLTLLGANSVEALPMCVAPWILLPLVRGSEGGSPRRAGLLCGVAVLCMGGVNAAADLAAVLPAVLFLLTRQRSRRTFALSAWAAGGAVLATVWWVVPLLLLGRYSPPFLDYIESAATTTSVTSLGETLRGTADWVAYLPSSGWHAGYLLLTRPLLVAESLLVVALGLAGLAASRSAHRPWLVTCLGVGVVAVTLGHAGDVGSLAAAAERTLLDTSLAPVRNVHKFDVVLRLPLVLGLADLLPRLVWGRTPDDRRRSRLVAGVLAVTAVVATATPLVTFGLANTNSFTALPGYWRQTAGWLAANSGDGRALLVPAAKTPSYLWGTPTDEPVQPLADSAWDVRNNVPLTPPGRIRVLDAADALIATGVAQPQLAGYLERAGVRYLVVRNDLDYRAVQATAPAVVQATLSASPGLRRVARYGPTIGGEGDYRYSVDQGLQPAQAAVEIWAVTGTGDPRVATSALSTVQQVSGGPESVRQLLSAGVASDPTIATGATAGVRAGEVVLTDGLRRREVNYGGPADQRSPTLTATQGSTLDRRVLDYLPVPGEQHQSVVRYSGARAMTASSSASDVAGFFGVRPDRQPFAAFDGDPDTAWHSAPGVPAVGQWVEVRSDRAMSNRVTVRLPERTPVTRLTVGDPADPSTGATVRVRDGVASATLPAATDRLRVTVAAVARDYLGPAAIAEITVPGLRVTRTVVAPDDLPADRTVDTVSFATPGDARTGCLLADEVPQCVAGRARGSEDGSGLDRAFTLARGATYDVALTATPRAGAALDSLLRRSVAPTIVAASSTQAVPDPLAGPQSAVDADGSTGWVAAADDPDPSITLTLPRAVRLDRLNFFTTAALAATRPDLVRITSPAGTRSTVIGSDGLARFAALTTDRLTLHLGAARGRRALTGSSVAGVGGLGFGVSEIVVPGVTTTPRVASAARAVSLPCGSGPDVVLDGRAVATRATTTVAALRDRRTVPLTACGDARFTVPAGAHRLLAAGTALWDTTAVTLTRSTTSAATAAAPTPRVSAWGRTTRTVRVPARTTAVLLTVDENVNAGWRASVDDRALTAVTVDGWKQGYLLPAGSAAVVALEFTPQRTYGAALVVGAIAVLALLALTVLWRRRRSTLPPARTLRLPPLVGAAAVVLTGVLVGGTVGGVVVVLTAAGLTVAGRRGPHRWTARIGPGVAFAAIAVVGVTLAVAPVGTSGYAGNTAIVQVLCLVALSAAMLPRTLPRTLPRIRPSRPSRSSEADPS